MEERDGRKRIEANSRIIPWRAGGARAKVPKALLHIYTQPVVHSSYKVKLRLKDDITTHTRGGARQCKSRWGRSPLIGPGPVLHLVVIEKGWHQLVLAICVPFGDQSPDYAHIS